MVLCCIEVCSCAVLRVRLNILCSSAVCGQGVQVRQGLLWYSV